MKNIFKNKNMKEVRIMKATKRLTALVLSLITAFSCMISASALTPDELVYDDLTPRKTILREIHNFFDVMLPTDITIGGQLEYPKQEKRKLYINDVEQGEYRTYWSHIDIKISAKHGKIRVAGATFDAAFYAYDENGELIPTVVKESKGIKTGEGIRLPQEPGIYFLVVTTCNGGYRDGADIAVGMNLPTE